MTAKPSLWQRWKRLAHRAAEIQAFIVLTIAKLLLLRVNRQLGRTH